MSRQFLETHLAAARAILESAKQEPFASPLEDQLIDALDALLTAVERLANENLVQ